MYMYGPLLLIFNECLVNWSMGCQYIYVMYVFRLPVFILKTRFIVVLSRQGSQFEAPTNDIDISLAVERSIAGCKM